jgi:hypothetical protein
MNYVDPLKTAARHYPLLIEKRACARHRDDRSAW